MKKILVVSLCAALLVGVFQNCGYLGKTDNHMLAGSGSIDFGSLSDITFAPKCTQCHAGASPLGGYDLSTYEGTMKNVVPFEPENSKLVKRLRDGSMPTAGPLSNDEIEVVEEWIRAGAPNTGQFPGAGGGNPAPTVNAGADVTLTLPTNSQILNGKATAKKGGIKSVQWSQVNGPATATLTNTAELTVTVSNLVEGKYTFRLEATDDAGLVGKDEVDIVVQKSPNQLPVVNAGADQTLVLPTNQTTINGTAQDPDGTIATYVWTQVFGPNQATLNGANTATLNARGLSGGFYTFRLTATDNLGGKSQDEMRVFVNAAGNTAPVVNAGPDKTVQLPTNSVQLTATANDPGGSVASVGWTQVSGPQAAVLSGVTTLNLTASSLAAGIYVFEFRAFDNQNAVSFDTAQVTVVAGEVPAPTWTQINNEILKPKCLVCHGAANPLGNYSVADYASTMKGVVANNGADSKLYKRVNDNTMPQGGPPLTAEQKEAIKKWIDAGALNN